ncbi:DUF6993 domain-containing protein [Microbacterium sp. B2969]|uniref:DUF6993 domain-containing protein n=1 Tax=Microbacterium alkaliflavum TaxID=3248839 RepID=A0ABW7Q5B4_9MICO
MAVSAAAMALGAGLLAGCTVPGTDGPSSTAAATPTASASPAATSTPEPTPPAAPVFHPDGSAQDNLPFFASIVASVWAGPDQASGRAYIDALVAAGFDKSTMQVTNDESTVGNRAESIQFSVLWAGECLVGQVGPATGDPVSVVLPVVGDGACLIGQTRPIDW